ncbi:MAG TPA: TIGR03790 family protein [Vicinamibacterales bacterium]|nr:TIGR03790 family protein [Vicinamibacterales bacterium]
MTVHDRRLTVTYALAAVLFLSGGATEAVQNGSNVLLVINSASPASVQIGEHYAAARNLPAENIIRLTAPTTETIERVDYLGTIQAPMARWLARHGLQDRIHYIVLTKGVPLRINGTAGRDGTTASVDSELTLLYRRMLGESPAILGREPNPWFLGERPVAEATRFSRAGSDLYLVTRLDGYTVDDVLALVDRGMSPSREGRIVLDQRATLRDAGGDRWLAEAASAIEAVGEGDRVIFESTRALGTTTDPVLGYYSWGSNDPANQLRGGGDLEFAPGALAGMFVSTDGRTFQEPPADWKPGPSNRPLGPFGSGSQSMAADFIRQGASGASAHVSEPYLDGTIRPQVLFPAYLRGFNLAESYYLAMPFLSWQTIVIGDPLVAPFEDAPAPAPEAGLDPETELPRLFSERRLATLDAGNLNVDAVKLTLRADVYLAREQQPEAEKLLAQAIELEPRLLGTALQLAGYHEGRGEHDQARARYKGLLDVDPDHAIALNNLAYSLAVHAGQPKDALPLAERAFRRSPIATVADTLAWVHHLLGDHRAAKPLIERAAATAPNVAEIQLHAAFIHAALGELARARVELAAALKLDAALAERDDVKGLREKLGGG